VRTLSRQSTCATAAMLMRVEFQANASKVNTVAAHFAHRKTGIPELLPQCPRMFVGD